MTKTLLDRLVVAVGTQYLVDAEIGRGGMAVVYGATDLRLHRRVAIKVLPPELAFNADVRERFLREAQTSAQLAHPSIVPIYTVDEREGIVYFVMALVDGESLGQRLAREPRPPFEFVRRILAEVADALAYAHEKGVVHRDVKPDNILLDRATGRALVTDFGIARAAAGDTRLTVTGVAIGTPAYMSPEQAIGERDLDGRSDIYSLGIIGYQMIAGETPFRASNTPAMLVKHMSETPRALRMVRPDTPGSLAHAIERALAKRPDDRWESAGAFRTALLSTQEPPQGGRLDPGARSSSHGEGHAADAGRRMGVAGDPSYRPSPLHAVGPVAPLPPLALSQMPPMPAMPDWGSRSDWRTWRHAQREWERERNRRDKAVRRMDESNGNDALPVAERVRRFRRKLAGNGATILMLGGLNLMTSPETGWFIFPAFFLGLGVVRSAGALWADGISVKQLLGFGPKLPDSPSASAGSLQPPRDAAQALAPADVLAGPYGETVRRAADDRHASRQLLDRLDPSERSMIPDVAPTVDALAERVGSIAQTLHRLDGDVRGSSLDTLDERLARLRAESGETPTSEQERRIALLERQRTSIAELTERRGALLTQLESASLALQNLRLDLLKLRSSGLGTAMSDVVSATQEARALSRDIGHVVDAAREVRRL